LQRAWKEDLVPQDWFLADGIDISKEHNSIGVGSFPLTSLLNVEGKIFFSVLAHGPRPRRKWVHRHICVEGRYPGIPFLPGTRTNGLEFLQDHKAGDERTACGMA